MKAVVDAVFTPLSQGKLPVPVPAGAQGGDDWELALPGGVLVGPAALQAQATPLIELGSAVVLPLLPWVKHESAAVRYVALYALEEITGERPGIGHLDEDPQRQEAAITAWRRWHDRHTAQTLIPS